MSVNCVLASSKIAQVNPDGRPLPRWFYHTERATIAVHTTAPRWATACTPLARSSTGGHYDGALPPLPRRQPVAVLYTVSHGSFYFHGLTRATTDWVSVLSFVLRERMKWVSEIPTVAGCKWSFRSYFWVRLLNITLYAAKFRTIKNGKGGLIDVRNRMQCGWKSCKPTEANRGRMCSKLKVVLTNWRMGLGNSWCKGDNWILF
jgi:hypothetical protein